MSIVKNQEKIFVAGHNGLVGSSVLELLLKNKKKVIIANKNKLDLTDYKKVYTFLKKKKINQIYQCAGVIGGILANKKNKVEFLQNNILIEFNIIRACFELNIKKLILYSSSNIYPENLNKKLKESAFVGNYTTNSHSSYVLAKIASLKLASNYVTQYPEKKLDFKVLICCGIFGKNDNLDEEKSHVLPAIVKKAVIAKKLKKKKIVIWGTGKPKREFLSSEEVAKISYFLMNINKDRFQKITKKKIYINVGSGIEYSITKLTKIILKIINYRIKIIKDLSKPDGIRSKCLNIGNLKKLGWRNSIPFLKTLKKYIFEINKNYIFN